MGTQVSNFFTYFAKHYDYIGKLLLEHIQITFTALGISIFIAIILSVLIYRIDFLATGVVAIFGALYAIPSLALFAMLVPVFGLGKTCAIIVLVSYLQYILIRNILAGFHSIDPTIIEAASGMGLSSAQVFFKIRLPLALPVIIGGIRIATVATIGMPTIAATINAGGLGLLLFEGMRTFYPVKIIWGTILCSGLTILANTLLFRLEEYFLRKSGGQLPTKEVLNKEYGGTLDNQKQSA